MYTNIEAALVFTAMLVVNVDSEYIIPKKQ